MSEPEVSDLKPLSYRLVISDFLELLDPTDYGVQCEVTVIDPSTYFITSGDALLKAKQLLKDYHRLAVDLGTKRPMAKYKNAVNRNIKKCEEMVAKLFEVRGTALFLELEWGTDRTLICIPKNPRGV